LDSYNSSNQDKNQYQNSKPTVLNGRIEWLMMKIFNLDSTKILPSLKKKRMYKWLQPRNKRLLPEQLMPTKKTRTLSRKTSIKLIPVH